MKKQRLDLQVGVKYRGYGFINAFGEFEFTPEQTGSRQGRRRVVKEGECYSISETSATRIFHITLPKELTGFELIKAFMKVMNSIIDTLRDYEV